jgi:5-methylthioadenosine/S-adenosylhomocysteine deaminase
MSKTIGSIQEGKKADLVVLDLNQVHNVPLSNDLYTAIVYTADSRNVEQVWVDGERVVNNRNLLVADVNEIVQRVNGL